MGVYNKKSRIPGVTGKRIPGSGKPRRVGGFTTRVPDIRVADGGSAAFREYHRRQIRDIHGRFAGGWGFAWIGLQATDEALYEWAGDTTRKIQEIANELAKEIETWMKNNAPWEDRTAEQRIADGDPPGRSAREELQAKVTWNNNNTFQIMLSHGEDIYYGIWLEVRWGGKYAILQPAAEYFAPQISGRIKAAL